MDSSVTWRALPCLGKCDLLMGEDRVTTDGLGESSRFPESLDTEDRKHAGSEKTTPSPQPTISQVNFPHREGRPVLRGGCAGQRGLAPS